MTTTTILDERVPVTVRMHATTQPADNGGFIVDVQVDDESPDVFYFAATIDRAKTLVDAAKRVLAAHGVTDMWEYLEANQDECAD